MGQKAPHAKRLMSDFREIPTYDTTDDGEAAYFKSFLLADADFYLTEVSPDRRTAVKLNNPDAL